MSSEQEAVDNGAKLVKHMAKTAYTKSTSGIELVNQQQAK